MGFSMQNDLSKLIENAIYLHLLHQRFDVFTGQLPGGSEIDFVARRDDAVVYVQATYRMDSEATREREFGSLLAIRNNYPKLLLSGKSVAGRRMAEGHPKPDEGGFACSPGSATEGSATPGRPPERSTRCKCKSHSRGQHPR